MAFPSKRLNILSALIKKQATFGTPVSPSAATDGFQLQYDNNNVATLVDDEWEYNGSLGPSPSSLNEVKPVPPSGHGGTAKLPHRWKGSGVAYAASGAGRPHNADVALQIAGFDATTDTTSGNEKVTYSLTPDSTTPTAASCEFWCAQVDGASNMEKRVLEPAIADLEMSFTDKSPPKWILTARGGYTDPTESAFTLPTYPHSSVLEPLASNFTFTWNSISGLVIYEGSFKLGRDISQANIPQNNSGAHLGFVPGGFKGMMFEVLMQAPKFATANFYSLVAAATAGALQYKCGSTQYNRWTINGPTAVPISAKPEARGPIQCLRVQFGLFASTPSATDAVNVVFD